MQGCANREGAPKPEQHQHHSAVQLMPLRAGCLRHQKGGLGDAHGVQAKDNTDASTHLHVKALADTEPCACVRVTHRLTAPSTIGDGRLAEFSPCIRSSARRRRTVQRPHAVRDEDAGRRQEAIALLQSRRRGVPPRRLLAVSFPFAPSALLQTHRHVCALRRINS